MIHRHRTPIQRFLSNVKIALLSTCLLAVTVSARPLSGGKGPDAVQLSSNNALAPKSAQNKRDTENVAAPSGPLSPEHEQARDLWNRVKKVRHQLKPRRYIRSVAHEEHAVVDNVTIPKYIRELYDNLTKGSATEILQQSSQANTVRSLQTVNNDPLRCDIFNFSLSSINSSEYIVKAELRFSLDRKQSSHKNVVVAIKSAKSKTEAILSRNDITVENNDKHKHVFDVGGVVSSWIKNGAKYAEFQVQFFADFSNDAPPLDCANIHFFHQSNDEETEPLLIVHSYDSEVEKIDYRTILERLNRTTSRRRRSTTAEVSNDSRDPRQSEEIPFCNMFPLNITRLEIPKKDNDEQIVLPHVYNAGVCGGNCGNTMPVEQDLKHNVLLHMLQSSNEFRDRHGYHITRCCAPIKYSPLEVIVNPPPNDVSRKGAYMRIIPNMRIVKCECLEIVDFSRSTSRRK